MAAENLEQRVKNLEDTIKNFQHEIERLQAINEIHNLMSKYEYLHTANLHQDVIEMYAKKAAPSVTVCVQNMGLWKGEKAAWKAWENLDRHTRKDSTGMMAIHPITTPVIEVAKDGKTAKGVWIGTGLVASRNKETGEPHAMWEWDRYGVDFIKEDGKWKFWHFHIYRIFKVGWDNKWADQFANLDKVGGMPIADDLKPDAPATDDYPYSPTTDFKNIPLPPEPYETFDEKTAY